MMVADNTVSLTEISGTLAETPVSGRLRIAATEPPNLRGEIEIGAVDLPAALAAVLGVPAQSAGATSWPSEPFGTGLLGRVNGRVVVKSARVVLTPKLAAQNLRAVVTLDPAALSIDDIAGTLAGGRVSGAIMVQRSAEILTAHSQLRLAGAEAAALVAGDRPAAQAPVAGGVTLDLVVDASGRSPVALIGALQGSGSFMLQDGRLTGLDPAAFEAVTRAVDAGLPIDVARIRERMETALGNGNLPVALAEGSITIADGQLRLLNTAVHARGAELAVTAGVDLIERALDARLILSRPPASAAMVSAATASADTSSAPAPATLASVTAASGRPQVSLALKGPVDAPKRTLEVNALASWLALRAVDQQSERLDALQGGGAGAPPAASAAGEAAAPLSASPLPPTHAAPGAAPAVKPAVIVRPRAVHAAPVAEQLPAMPPPIDIRPLPAPRAQRAAPVKPKSPPVTGAPVTGASAISAGP
jgi:large subunit ribosomal protein L24